MTTEVQGLAYSVSMVCELTSGLPSSQKVNRCSILMERLMREPSC